MTFRKNKDSNQQHEKLSNKKEIKKNGEEDDGDRIIKHGD